MTKVLLTGAAIALFTGGLVAVDLDPNQPLPAPPVLIPNNYERIDFG